MRHDLDPTQYAEADRREVDPPIEVESATWSAGGQLDGGSEQVKVAVRLLGTESRPKPEGNAQCVEIRPPR